MKGFYHKYTVTKANDKPIDPDARYFVLRYDTDIHARRALRAYAVSVHEDNPEFARDLFREIRPFVSDRRISSCNCREASCPHEPMFSDEFMEVVSALQACRMSLLEYVRDSAGEK